MKDKGVEVGTSNASEFIGDSFNALKKSHATDLDNIVAGLAKRVDEAKTE